jgi:hypothetical protein
MNELNQDGLVPDQEVSFEELKRIESERKHKFSTQPAVITQISQQAQRKRKERVASNGSGE